MSETDTEGGRRRLHARVTGTVQGVGFRPYVFRLAEELDLAGFVLNDEHGVVCEVEGEAEAVADLMRRLPRDAPPLATVEAIETTEVGATGELGFRIVASEHAGPADAPVSPDSATCDDCLRELFDPADRRHRYPFINCTHCGPRFTIILEVPYDRPATAMAGFEMCGACRREYEDPRDRRFHAQPNACPRCGPRAGLCDREGREVGGGDAIAAAAEQLQRGRIVAVKGLGGFHLACLAADETAVAELRARKHREDKPFALMAPSLEAARELVELTPAEEAILCGRERPILIARRRLGAEVAASVAPGSRDLGLMLPYSPLHHLLAADAGTTLVMTSANVSDEPIAYRDDDARERLGAIADLFLLHDRPIHMRTDDSVTRALAPELRAAPLLIRRSRGYVPASLGLPVRCERDVLGCGAELKSTFCLAKGDRAWVGHHIGDLKNWETLRSFREGIEHFERLFAVTPALVAHDLHPDYLSTRYAQERDGVELEPVQHHHAHLAACLAEHGRHAPALGAIFDGSGLGPDGTVWGGELLVGDLVGFERVGLLLPVRLPGGDAAVAEPWRMACSWLAAVEDGETAAPPVALAGAVAAEAWDSVAELAATGVGSPLTSSAGRLFDAVAAICGVRARVNYEGQAAAELEGASDPRETASYPMPLSDGEPIVLDPRPTLVAVRDEIAAGAEVGIVGARFHNALGAATAEACSRAAEAHGLGSIVLSGGVFQNRLLLERTVAALQARGMTVLIPERLPPNDGGIAYGQVAVAAAREASRN